MESTDRSGRVMQLAIQLAEKRNDSHTNTGHLLYGLCKESSGMGNYILRHCYDVTPEMIVQEMDKITLAYKSEQKPVTSTKLHLVFQCSEDEAIALGHTKIGPEHLLLGILKEGQSIANQILKNLGLHEGSLRTHILELLQVYERNFKLKKADDGVFFVILTEKNKEDMVVGIYLTEPQKLSLSHALDINEIERLIKTIRKG